MINTSDPLISIVTPVLNGGKYLAESIKSVLNQSYTNIEHIFVDGGSTDGTIELLEQTSSMYPGRINLISAPGVGAGDATILGFREGNGEIFGIIGADDFYEDGALETVVGFFRSNPEACFVHGYCDFIDEYGEVIGQHRVNTFDFQEFINTTRHIVTPSSFYKRSVVEKVLLDTRGDDFEMMIRITREFAVHHVDKVLSRLTIRVGSTFVPSEPQKVLQVYRDTYRISRHYGGSAISRIALRYYRIQILMWLHMGYIYGPMMYWWRKIRRMMVP